MSNEGIDSSLLPKWVQRIFYTLIALSLFSMMALIFCDVFLRYFFNAPLVGALEIIQFLLAIVIFSSLPIVTAQDGHIVVALFDRCFHGRGRLIQHLVISVVTAVVLGLISSLMVKQGNSALNFQKVTGYLELPLAWLIYVIAILAAASLVVHVWVAVSAFKRLRGRHD